MYQGYLCSVYIHNKLSKDMLISNTCQNHKNLHWIAAKASHQQSCRSKVHNFQPNQKALYGYGLAELDLNFFQRKPQPLNPRTRILLTKG